MQFPRWYVAENIEDVGAMPRRRNTCMLAAADPAQLAEILQRTNLRHLHIEAGFDAVKDRHLRALRGMSRLESLCIKLCPSITNATLRVVSHLGDSLRILEIITCHPLDDESLSLVARLPRLRTLDLTRCDDVTDAGVDRLTACPRLAKVTLRDCRNLTASSLRSLGRLRALRSLGLWRCPQLGNDEIPLIAQMTRLEKLDLYQWNGLTHQALRPLTALQLRELTLLGNPALEERMVQKRFPRLWLRGVGE